MTLTSPQDLRFSARFPQKAGWSYEACATPLPVVVAPAAPSASYTAPSAAFSAPAQISHTHPGE